MKVTVNDCLELAVFKKASVVAGNQGLSNRVSAISFLEQGDAGGAEPNLHKKDEMILTASFAGNSEETQLRAIRSMSEAGEAALVLFSHDAEAYRCSQSVSALADELRLPVILLSGDEDITYADVVDAVMEKVLYGDNFANRLISNTIFHLLNFEKHSW
jgi:predicted transcriptional regulator